MNEEFLNVNEKDQNRVVKRHQNLQKLIQMAGAIDENNTIKQLEFDRNKSMDYRVVLRKWSKVGESG